MKIVFLDVDGTLIDYEAKLPASAAKAVDQARANGHKVYICTGCSKAEILQRNLCDLDGMIGGNGAYVEDNNHVVMHQGLSKEDVKNIQLSAQEDGIMPQMDYSHYQTKDLAMSIGKNAGVLGLQSAAVTTGLNIANKIFNGEEVNPDEMVEIAIKTGTDTSIKVVTAGTLQVAVRKGIIRFITLRLNTYQK